MLHLFNRTHVFLYDSPIIINNLMLKNTTTQFDFSAKPKVTALKPKYREPREEDGLYGTSLMNDPRIIRGNTYAAIVQNKNEVQPPPKKKVIKQAPKRKERKINFDTGFQPQTPRAVDGRQHFTCQTQPFVETLRDKPVQYEKQCQTDLFLDRPVQRQFDPMKQKTGVDRTTQIEQNDAQLFNFDYEVQPILEALLSKVVQTSRMQLYEENQLKQKEKQKDQYQKKRHARLAEAQKLQANETRLKQQYDRRQLQYRKSNEQECFSQKKVISRILSKQYLKNLRQNTHVILAQQGFYRQPLQTVLYESFTPWLYEKILNELQADQNYQRTVQQMTKQVQEQMQLESNCYIKKQLDRRRKIQEQKAEVRRIKKQKQEEARRIKQQEQAKKRQQEELAAKQLAQGAQQQQAPLA